MIHIEKSESQIASKKKVTTESMFHDVKLLSYRHNLQKGSSRGACVHPMEYKMTTLRSVMQ